MFLSVAPAALPGGASARRPTSFIAGFARWCEAASRRLAIRRARRELLQMPDSLLADIGIARSEIESAVRHGRPALGRR